jgi:hypothetical protein
VEHIRAYGTPLANERRAVFLVIPVGQAKALRMKKRYSGGVPAPFSMDAAAQNRDNRPWRAKFAGLL